MILALAGGVGGAKLIDGLSRILSPSKLTAVVNTADDFEHLGLQICPDLDTVMYTLAGRANPETGWGLAGESWNLLEAFGILGGETWFRLGDKDLATHLRRTQLLRSGRRLTGVTASLCEALGVRHAVLPMSDDPVRTLVFTDEGTLAFQEYFVRRQCSPKVNGLVFEGNEAAQPSASFTAAIAAPELEAIVICPSNPYLSVDPILSLKNVRSAIQERGVPVIAVSPIVAGRALKGPAAKLMAELGHEASALGIARHYAGIATGFVLDECDRALAARVVDLGIRPSVMATVMSSTADRVQLASDVLAFARSLG